MALLERCFADMLNSGFSPHAVEATIQYRKEAIGDLQAIASMTTEEQKFIRASLQTRKRANFAVEVQIVDKNGSITSTMQVKWMVLPDCA